MVGEVLAEGEEEEEACERERSKWRGVLELGVGGDCRMKRYR